jgi:hypothetical protein
MTEAKNKTKADYVSVGKELKKRSKTKKKKKRATKK